MYIYLKSEAYFSAFWLLQLGYFLWNILVTELKKFEKSWSFQSNVLERELVCSGTEVKKNLAYFFTSLITFGDCFKIL